MKMNNQNNCKHLLFQVKALCGTPEFVAPEVASYDFISTGTGEKEEEKIKPVNTKFSLL